jgi:hypothetical protein
LAKIPPPVLIIYSIICSCFLMRHLIPDHCASLMAFHDLVSYHERMRLLFMLTIMVFALQAQAYELLVVQTVSSTQKSFITRNGKRQGIMEGMTGTFIANDVAFHAKARTVTSQFTQWEMVNPGTSVPFKVGEIVTYHPAQEYLWALNPEVARQKVIELTQDKPRNSFLVKGAAIRGLNETVSGAPPQSAARAGYAMDALFERLFWRNVAWDAGIRYENEVVNVSGGSLTTERLLVVADLLYYFNPMEHFHGGRIYLGAGTGYGQSSTSSRGVTQSGSAMLMPSGKFGLTLPFSREWDFLTEMAFENLKTDEKLEVPGRQTTNQSNLRIGLGLRRFF